MPEDHARPVFLLMEKIEAAAQKAVIEFVHEILHWLDAAVSRPDGGFPKAKAPSVAGGALDGSAQS
jgi:hypothetical protein